MFVFTVTYVGVSWGKKCLLLRKIWRALLSSYLRFEIHPFVLLPTYSRFRSLFKNHTQMQLTWYVLKIQLSRYSKNSQGKVTSIPDSNLAKPTLLNCPENGLAENLWNFRNIFWLTGCQYKNWECNQLSIIL